MIEALLRKRANRIQAYFVVLCEKAYGEIGGTIFVRCLSCHKIVTANRISETGRCLCGGKRYKETNLTVAEEIYWIGRAIWTNLKKS